MIAGYYRRGDGVARLAAPRGRRASQSQLQIMYGLAGERRLHEWELAVAAGLREITTRARRQRRAEQLQLDVYGEVLDALHQARRVRHRSRADALGGRAGAASSFSSASWQEPDEGIWEVRGDAQPLHALQGDGAGWPSTAR